MSLQSIVGNLIYFPEMEQENPKKVFVFKIIAFNLIKDIYTNLILPSLDTTNWITEYPEFCKISYYIFRINWFKE